jgi:hypothetical protein
MMVRLIILTALAAVAGCGPQISPSGFIARTSKGQSLAGIQADAAQCRNQARLVVGANRYAWFGDVYSDCMLGRGYEKDVGQTE